MAFVVENCGSCANCRHVVQQFGEVEAWFECEKCRAKYHHFHLPKLNTQNTSETIVWQCRKRNCNGNITQEERNRLLKELFPRLQKIQEDANTKIKEINELIGNKENSKIIRFGSTFPSYERQQMCL